MPKLKSTVTAGCLLFLTTGLSDIAQACGIPSDVVLAQVVLNVTYPDALHVTGATWGLQKNGTIDMPDRDRLMATGQKLDTLIYEAHLADLDALELLGAAMHTNSHHAHSISIVLIDGMHWARFLPNPQQPYDAANFNRLADNRTDGDLIVVTTKPVLHGIQNGRITIANAVEQGAINLYGTDHQKSSFLADFGTIGGSDLLETSTEESLVQRLAKGAALEKILSPTFYPETK